MKIKDARIHCEKILAETSKKYIIKNCETFIQILNSLEKRDLSDADIDAIELKLDILSLNPDGRKLYKTLSEFKTFLKNEFSLTVKDHFTSKGTALGVSLGMMFGLVVLPGFANSLSLPVGLCMGMAIGITIGRKKDANAEAAGNVL